MPKLSPDEKWKRFNNKLEELMSVNNFYSLGITYFEMAEFLDKEGKNSDSIRLKGNEMKLIAQREVLNKFPESIQKLEIISDIECCDECKKLNGKVLSKTDAISENLLPVVMCKNKYGCRCTYTPVIK